MSYFLAVFAVPVVVISIVAVVVDPASPMGT